MVSLYFHVPFCSRKCPYCHFYVLPDQEALKKRYLAALFLEWQSILPKLAHHTIVSIYFGGGTPSLLAPATIGEILSWVRQTAPDCEITLEVNPEHATLDLMRAFAAEGINRVSIGVQSLDDSSLNVLGREHGSKKAIQAIEHTYQAGLHNISIDLMYDLPGQTLASWERTLEQVGKLPITHLSLYNLTIEPHTSFFKRRQELTALLPPPETSLHMLNHAVVALEAMGLNRYEVSAFAKPGYFSRHNTGYWIARPFLGLGPSAFSYWDKKRFRNVANLNRYSAALEKGESPIDFEEKLNYPDDLHELLAVQIRLLEGVDLIRFEHAHGRLPEATHRLLEELKGKGWIKQSGSRVHLTQEGLLFYDSVAEALI